MPMSLHSVELLNRLADATKLPQHFLRAFISHCIASCQQAKVSYCALVLLVTPFAAVCSL